ncbi:MAG: DNA topoisomerase IB [Solirubrobacteraceae bacterium]
MARLRRADPGEPGFTRRRCGRGHTYLEPSGETIDNTATRERIQALAIPPAWRDVWICRDPLGHLQATGVDAAGRKQYLYHQRWRARRDRAKFEAMLEFAVTLPRLRRRLRRELRGDVLTRERVLAGALTLLDLGLFRIGSESYAEDNGSYGLVTLRKRHVEVGPRRLIFDFEAKGGRRRVQTVDDRTVRGLVAALKRRRGGGDRLLAYHAAGRWVPLHAEDVNDRLKELTGGDFSAKDFRTWNATALAAVGVAALDGSPSTSAARKRALAAVVRSVAEQLGNTPAVCRRSYIDPRVFDRFRTGHTIADTLAPMEIDLDTPRQRERVEAAVIELLG